MAYEQVWSKETPNWRVVLYAEIEYGYQYDGEDPGGEIQAKLDSDEWHCYIFKVAVEHKRLGLPLGTEYLGGSVYADPKEFVDYRACGRSNRERAAKGSQGRCGSYLSDMVHTAIAEARSEFHELLGTTRLRKVA